MTCRKRLNKAGLELRPESTALAVHDLLPLVELCWAWGSGSGFHTRVRAQNPDGPVGRAGWVWGGGGVGRGGVGRVGVGRGQGGYGERAEWAGWEWGGGGVGRGRSGEREGGVAQGLLVGCCLQGEDPLPPLRGVCIPTTACVDIPCLIKIYRLLCYFKVK